MEIADADPVAHQKGCIVANTIVEMSFVDEDLKQVAVEILKETETFYREIIAKEQERGNICSKLPAATLARHLITFWCGINSLLRMYPDKNTLRTQIKLNLELLD
ncbi:TetR family transcriptional regulator C-terminal domain-containing protein [Niabella hibiscisoli]|uniref:TetR family transcriptional regulator C-terminal domain-containing protein n=1 Tax=Niabella hibiscisoli TaxID=1825928 RepID=UPI001F0FF6C5|nr:TetR family transcriptional regulator C-terminal domain-containing protein [Niabella hibiscisoli]MCH5719780.1 TetR family transcriptional regulator C-terminal domain-containing protein [Niabella hibiscisoli]